MSENASTADKRANKKGKRRGRIVPLLCNLLGIVFVLTVLAMALPLAVPRMMGYDVFNVTSGSMDPEIPMDSVVYVEHVEPADIKVSDVIAYNREDRTIVHRVVTNRTSVGEFVTKGDANEEEDPNPIPYENYIGRVALSVPAAGKFMALYSSNVGKGYLILALACGVMLNMLASRMRADQRRRIIEGLIAGTTTPEEEAAAEAEKRMRLRRLRKVLVGLFALVFIGSAAGVAFIYHERSESQRIYKEASDRFTQDVETGEPKDKVQEQTIAPKVVDFDKLCGENEDVVGWLYCPDTIIDYPVLHGKDNDEYLRHDYTREYNINGSIFVDADNARGFTDANTIVYGHHMATGAMFAVLEEWGAQSYYEEHPVMWLLTPTQDYQVVLVSGHHASAYSDMYEIYHEHDNDFARFLQEAVDQSDFKPIEDATVNPKRNYIMLSTCAYIFDNARYVLHGKLVPVNSAGGVPKK